jgi:hypothetical protein
VQPAPQIRWRSVARERARERGVERTLAIGNPATGRAGRKVRIERGARRRRELGGADALGVRGGFHEALDQAIDQDLLYLFAVHHFSLA